MSSDKPTTGPPGVDLDPQAEPEDAYLDHEERSDAGVGAPWEYGGATDHGDLQRDPPAVATEPMIVISPRLVGLVAFVFGLACLAALAFVAAVRDADALATVALALAIVAFAVQLLASASQNQSSTQQSLRSEQLNTQTRGLLSEMQTTARGTERMVREQFGQLLRAFMDAAKAAERGKDFDPDEFEQRLMRNMRQQIPLTTEASTASSGASVGREAAQTALRRRRERVARASGPFPPQEEAEPIVPDLLAVPLPARSRLRQYGVDKAQIAATPNFNGYEGFPVTGSGSDPLDEVLREHGLLHLVRMTGSRTPEDGLAYQLTEKGDLGARILNSEGEVPEWAEPLFRG
jgi:hypothetical protein